MGTTPIADFSSDCAMVFSASSARPRALVQPILSDAGTPAWVEQVTRRVDELARLGRNWDGRYADEISCDVLYFAWAVLNTVMRPQAPAPAMIALSHGGVQLVWSTGETEVEVEIIRPNEAIIYWRGRDAAGNESEQEWPASTDFGKLAEVLEKAYH